MDALDYLTLDARLKVAEGHATRIEWIADYLRRLTERIEKLEAALKEGQAKTAELDKILSGAVKDVCALKPMVKRALLMADPATKYIPDEEWRSRYFQATDPQATDINDGTAKMVSDKHPDAGVAHVAPSTMWNNIGYNIAMDPTASPSGIPFSVALEFMKAGRKVRRVGMGNGYIYAVADSFGVFLSNETQFDAIEIICKGLLTSDWEVLPEKPQEP